MTLGVDRGGKPVDITLVPDGDRQVRDVATVGDPADRASAGQLGCSPVDPATKPGCKPGDVVLAVGGEQRRHLEQRLVELIKANEGQPITLEIKRNGSVQHDHGDAAPRSATW